MAKYDANSIKTLNARESIRENIGMYIGDASSHGLHQLFIEGIANSIDEAVGGYGKVIEIDIDSKTNELTITDHGRGIRFGINADGKDALVEAVCNLHGGGKFIGQEGYKSSLGLHGLGLKCIHYLSTKFSITSVRDGKKCTLSFDENDKQSGPTVTIGNKNDSGTKVSFIPDATIFGNLKWDKKTIIDKIQTYALLNNNITFILRVDGTEAAKFCYKDGTKDLLNIKLAAIKDAKMVTTPVFQKEDVTNENGDHAYFEFGFVYIDKGVEYEYCYANGGETPNGGTYLTGFKSAYTSLINKLAKESDIKTKFGGDMVRRGLVMVMVMKADFRLQFAEQTKLTLNSPEARGLASKAVGQFEFDKKIIKQILDKVESEQKVEDAAQRKREAQEKITKGGHNLNSLRDLPEKLADASDFTDAEIFFCEGDSAAGGAKETKAANQAVLPLRGKIKNCTDLELADAIKSDIIKNILNCLGCGVGEHFNINNLRYKRIIIMCDADSDGGHINLLLTTLFLHHLPELIKQGRVFAAMPPLYRTKALNGEIKYWYENNAEYKKYLRNHKNVEITRFKGLGEMQPDELYATTMDPEHRHLSQLTTEDMEKTLKLYEELMGDRPELRRNFILTHKLSQFEGDDSFEEDDEDFVD